jgi:deoxyhypusine synthase
MGAVRAFMDRHFRHFNARETLEASRAWRELLDRGGQMFLSMAGAMSTGELGIILADMIRQDKVHAICCTGANIEEDVFGLFARDEYMNVPSWRDLNAADEVALRDRGLNRVTDVCVPETVMNWAESIMTGLWAAAARSGHPRFHYEFIYELIAHPAARGRNRIPLEHSWVLAAKEKGLPIFTPGWEDSTLGNMYTARVMDGKIPGHGAVHSGTAQMERLAGWYRERAGSSTPVGFFQIGGGIAGDFAVCVVPMLLQDCHEKGIPYWAYFCQIGDSVTSYGGYSGAPPNEKITWHKLGPDTPRFMIQSDATVVAPLIFAYVMDR